MLRNEMKNMFLLIVNKRSLLGLATFLLPLANLAQSQYDYYDDDAVVGGADRALSGLIIILIIVAVAIALLFIVFVIAKVYYWLNPETDPKYKSRIDNNEIKPDNYLYEPVYKENNAYIPVDFDYKNPADIQKYINQLKKDYELTKASSEDWEDKVIDWGLHADEEYEIWDRGDASYSKDWKKILVFENNLSEYKIKEGVEIVCDNSFSGFRSEKRIVFPNSLKVLGNFVFWQAYLKKIIIPQSVVKITGNPFAACKVYIECKSPHFCFVNNVLYDKEKIRIISVVDDINMITRNEPMQIDSSVKIVGRYSFYEISYGGPVILPESVLYIGESAFEHTIISEIRLGGKVVEIEKNAFAWSYIKSMQLSHSIKHIGESAFEHCDNLKTIQLPISLRTIESKTFYWCKYLEEVELPDGLKIIKKDAFSWCKRLSKINLPDSLERIETGAFTCCGFSEIIIPKHTIVEEGAFMQSCRIIRKE